MCVIIIIIIGRQVLCINVSPKSIGGLCSAYVCLQFVSLIGLRYICWFSSFIHRMHTYIRSSFIVPLSAFTWLTVYALTTLAHPCVHTTYNVWHKHALLYALLCFRFRSGAYNVSMLLVSTVCLLWIACCWVRKAASCISSSQQPTAKNVFRFVSFLPCVVSVCDSIRLNQLSWSMLSVTVYLSISHCVWTYIKYLCRRYVSVSLEWSANKEGSHFIALNRFYIRKRKIVFREKRFSINSQRINIGTFPFVYMKILNHMWKNSWITIVI